MKHIKILGTGCPKCKKLEELSHKAAEELKIEHTIEKIEDINEIISYGIMMTPGLVINETVVSSGKLLSIDEIKKLLSD